MQKKPLSFGSFFEEFLAQNIFITEFYASRFFLDLFSFSLKKLRPTSLLARNISNFGYFSFNLSNFLFFLDNLPDWKHLRGGVKFVDFIPRTPTGKIIRPTLKKLAGVFAPSLWKPVGLMDLSGL